MLTLQKPRKSTRIEEKMKELYDLIQKRKQELVEANQRKCIGPVPSRKKCNAPLNRRVNFTNIYCWNCIYNWVLKKGNRRLAGEIVDRYL